MPPETHVPRTVEADTYEPEEHSSRESQYTKTTFTARIVDIESVHYIQDSDTKVDLELGYRGQDRSAGASVDLVCGHHDRDEDE